MDNQSYAIGRNIGAQLKQIGLPPTLVLEDFLAGIRDTMDGKMDKATREEGEKFLAENAKREGVNVTASGLQYEVLTEGYGKQPKAENTVRCHYEGRLINGTVFDSSYKRGEPADFGLRQVIKGWTEGVQLMKEGAKFRFFIPYNLAYGETGAGANIPPFAALIFDVELIKVL